MSIDSAGGVKINGLRVNAERGWCGGVFINYRGNMMKLIFSH
jgi:hypothetical protein